MFAFSLHSSFNIQYDCSPNCFFFCFFYGRFDAQIMWCFWLCTEQFKTQFSKLCMQLLPISSGLIVKLKVKLNVTSFCSSPQLIISLFAICVNLSCFF